MNPNPASQNRKAARRIAVLAATLLGAGRVPLAPGTAGSAMSVVAFVLLRRYAPEPFLLFHLLAVVFLSWIGAWACSESEMHFGKRDPREAIIDEVAGQQVALLGLPLGPLAPHLLWASGWKYFLAAFILFRIFDVAKPFPIRRCERLPGGWGMIADDLLAGAFSFLVLWVWRVLGR